MAELQLLDQFQFHHRLQEQAGPALVLFSSPACSACRSWEKLLIEYLEWPGLAVFKVDAQRDQALVREFDVFHLPALFLFSEGEFHAEIQCEASSTALTGALGQALSQPPREAP